LVFGVGFTTLFIIAAVSLGLAVLKSAAFCPVKVSGLARDGVAYNAEDKAIRDTEFAFNDKYFLLFSI